MIQVIILFASVTVLYYYTTSTHGTYRRYGTYGTVGSLCAPCGVQVTGNLSDDRDQLGWLGGGWLFTNPARDSYYQ